MLIVQSSNVLVDNNYNLKICDFGLTHVKRNVAGASGHYGLKGENELVVSRLGFVPTGFTADECKVLLVKAVHPDYQKELLKQSAGFTTDGKATDRVVELIYSLLKP